MELGVDVATLLHAPTLGLLVFFYLHWMKKVDQQDKSLKSMSDIILKMELELAQIDPHSLKKNVNRLLEKEATNSSKIEMLWKEFQGGRLKRT